MRASAIAMNPTVFFVRQQLQNLDSQCGTALARIGIARSMRDVKLACNVHAHSVVKPLADAKTLLRRVDQAAEQKLLQFLEVQMTELRSCATIDEFKAARGRLIRDQWEYLRGTFATIYRRAERDSMSIQAALERGAPSAQKADDENGVQLELARSQQPESDDDPADDAPGMR